jgi:PAS domain S-box-containing protein
MELFNRNLASRLRLISYVSALILLTGSILVITGWIVNSPTLTGIHPDLISMKFNTALSFLFLGGSLLTFNLVKRPHKRTISGMLAILAMIIPVLTMGQYLFGADLAIDEIFIADRYGETGTLAPGRMAPMSAASLIIAALSMLLLNRGKWGAVSLAQAFALGIILFSIVPLLGYIYGRPQIYGSPGFTSMSLPTVILLMVAGSGILFAVSRAGVMSVIVAESITGYAIRKFLPVILLLPVIMILLLLALELTAVVNILNDITLVSLILIAGFILIMLLFLRTLHVMEISRSRTLDRAHIANQQIRLHIENTPLAVIEWDNDFRVKKWSWQAREMFGWKPEEVYNKRPDEWKFVHEHDNDQVKDVMQKLGSGQETSAILSGRNFTKTGATVHCVWYNSVLYNRDGEMISVLSLIDNVTKQKRIERKLAEREEQYRSLVEISQDAILINQDNRIVFANAAACKLFGAMKPEQIIGKPSIELFHKDYHGIIKERIKNLVNGVPVPVIEEKIVRLDGGEVDVEVAASIFMYRKRMAIMVVIRDITERKLAHKNLKRNEFMLRMAGNLAQMGGWMINLSEGKVTWSEQVAAIHDMPPDYSPSVEEGIGFYAPEYTDRIRKVVNDCAEKGIPYDEELEIISGRGRRVWVRTIGVAERDESGSIVNIIGGFQDITSRKKNEQEIKKLNEELEERVRERTRQLESSNRDLEAFSYSISHDLRAPLRAINGFTRILLDDHSSRLDEQGIRVCHTITGNARRMGQLIDELLAFSRIGRRDIRYSLIDMNQMTAELYKEVTTPDERERIKLSTGELCSVYGDPAMIRQVWSNLLANSVKFTSMERNPHIGISCKLAGDFCEFSVKDNGIGFDMKYADRIFGVFKRLHSAKQFEGTGVGLAIVQRIIDKHGGNVKARGSPGKGAVISFTLPLKKPAGDPGLHGTINILSSLSDPGAAGK